MPTIQLYVMVAAVRRRGVPPALAGARATVIIQNFG